MADRALTREAVLSGLQDIRLPSDAAGGLLAELLAAIGVGLILAAMVGLVMRAISDRRTLPDVAADATEPDNATTEGRQLALLEELKRRRPDRFAIVAQTLYRPGPMPSVKMLETELNSP